MLLVGAATLLLIVLIVRSAGVAAFASDSPQTAAKFWSNHPDVRVRLGMAEVGEAAAAGRPIPATALERIREASYSAPLTPEPFLVRGVIAQLSEDWLLAEKLFRQARMRDPRDPAARYFLADLYSKTGRTGDALQEAAVLARLIPGGAAKMAPMIAAFAKTPDAIPALQTLFRNDPDLGQHVLAELALDAENAPLVLALATGPLNSDKRAREWQQRLVASLISNGEFSTAKALWIGFAGLQPTRNSLIFDSSFRGSDAPAPFNWTFASSAAGIAEPTNGSLHIVYFGRENVTLAEQLLLLGPGSYRLKFTVIGMSGDDSSPLTWVISCELSNKVLVSAPLADGHQPAAFEVGRACPAQRLRLVATASDLPDPVDLSLTALTLTQQPS